MQVYELITCARRANENAGNLISGVQFLINIYIYNDYLMNIYIHCFNDFTILFYICIFLFYHFNLYCVSIVSGIMISVSSTNLL